MERRIFGIRIPNFLPDGDYSVLNRLGSVTPRETPQAETERKPSPAEIIQQEILEALDSLDKTDPLGSYYANLREITHTIALRHPPEHWWEKRGESTVQDMLYGLAANRQIEILRVRTVDPRDGRAHRSDLYHRIKEEAPPVAII